MNIKVGDKVKFYDCDQARIDKDYSGKNPKHYPIGEVVDVYEKPSSVYNAINKLCDIKINDRISRGHFIHGVKLFNKKI
jgi:hypothetical protein